jgi:hypothetical protein
MLPLKRGGIIMRHLSSHDSIKCNIPCSNEHEGRGPEIRTKCEAPDGQPEGTARIRMAHRVSYEAIGHKYYVNDGKHCRKTSVIRKSHHPVI